jgi:glycosyltransferase involved in cell wall biosynthesis
LTSSEAPLVSVIVPTYNRARYIAETLDSALAQTHPRLEIIVVDDGSKDDTQAVLEPYRDRVKVIRQDNQGLPATRNAGLVSLVASDSTSFDERGTVAASHARTCYSVLGRTPGGLAGFFPRRTAVGDLPVYHGRVDEALLNGNCMHPPTIIFRLRRDADREYILRLSRTGEAAFVDRPLMRYRVTPDQMSSDASLTDRLLSRIRVLERLGARDPSLARSRAFRRRLGHSHLAAASALAEDEGGASVRHLLQSPACGYVDVDTARAIAKLVLPRSWLEARRRRRAAGVTAAQRAERQ